VKGGNRRRWAGRESTRGGRGRREGEEEMRGAVVENNMPIISHASNPCYKKP